MGNKKKLKKNSKNGRKEHFRRVIKIARITKLNQNACLKLAKKLMPFDDLTNLELVSVGQEKLTKVLDSKLTSSLNSTQCDLNLAPQKQDVNKNINSYLNKENDVPGINQINNESEILTSTENNTDSKSTILCGRRIVNIQLFLDNLKTIADHNSLSDCGLSAVNVVSEHKSGLYSRISLVCLKCGKKFEIETTDRDVNIEAVSGIMASGGGYIQLKQFTSAVDLSEINEKQYMKIQNEVAGEWKKTAWDEMRKAGQIEREAALKEGRINKDGIPLIDVILDGCWSRRSYQTNYAANSGCATIIGRRTGKVLFMAVKNKYCCICQRNGNNQKSHQCYKNYEGPSTGMEAAIIVEGFKKSIDMHNIIYQRFIADGDSNTYAKILEARPYPNITVEKIYCRNHILRRFCINMQKLCTDVRYAVKDRKLITRGRILSARKYIRDAIAFNKYEKNCEKLHHDINNSVCHAFGKHIKCDKNICLQTEHKLLELNNCGLWQKIRMIAANVASNSRSLIEDVDSNAVEQFNAIVAKLVGGKRINYSLRGGYETRCAGAVISYNTGKLLSTVYRNTHNKSPRLGIKRHETQISVKRERKRLGIRKSKRRFATVKYSDKHYGESSEQADMDPETFKIAKITFLENLQRTELERQRIAEKTILQSECSEWLELRRNLLTASNFGKIIKRRKNQSCHNIVKNMLYSPPIDHVSSIQHGKQYEKVALEQLSILKNIEIKKCGLYIDEEHCFLGATPDGISNDMVVEVKCPIAPFKTGCIDSAISQKKLHFWKQRNNGEVYINKKSDWYMQAQGQMHILRKDKCLLAIWYGENKFKIEILNKDDEFWKNDMEPHLLSFYMDCLLPELVDPRYIKNKRIRDPDYVTGIQRKQKGVPCFADNNSGAVFLPVISSNCNSTLSNSYSSNAALLQKTLLFDEL